MNNIEFLQKNIDGLKKSNPFQNGHVITVIDDSFSNGIVIEQFYAGFDQLSQEPMFVGIEDIHMGFKINNYNQYKNAVIMIKSFGYKIKENADLIR